MKGIHPERKWLVFLLGYAVFSILYLLTGNVLISTPNILKETTLDSKIPFLPWSIWIYLSQFLFVFVGAHLLKTTRAISVTFYSMALVSLISFLVFFIAPAQIVRTPDEIFGVSAHGFSLLYFLDASTNSLPSLHAALASCIVLGVFLQRSRIRWLIAFWAILIILSTLTTKQHYLADVFCGIFASVLTFLFVFEDFGVKNEIGVSRASRFLNSVRLCSLAFLPIQGRVKTLYEALSSNNSLGKESLYMNLGYWKDGVTDLDSAGDALADLLGTRAALSNGDRVLDVGFGFADQDIFWLQNFSPESIDGINISQSQFHKAKERVEKSGLSDRIRLKLGSATALSYPNGSFDVVLGLESAFHFNTREDFFFEASRVLRPGGRLILADLIGVDKAELSFKNRIAEIVGRSFWQIPKENLYSSRTYKQKLQAAGFKNIEVRSIWAEVYPGFVAFARKQLADEQVKQRMTPFFHRWLSMSMKMRASKSLDQNLMDYVLVYAEN